MIADFDQIPMIYAVADTLAEAAAFNLDEIADTKRALDYICAQLITGASAGTELRHQPE